MSHAKAFQSECLIHNIRGWYQRFDQVSDSPSEDRDDIRMIEIVSFDPFYEAFHHEGMTLHDRSNKMKAEGLSGKVLQKPPKGIMSPAGGGTNNPSCEKGEYWS